MTITHARAAGTTRATTEVEVERRMSFADAALGAAGHEVTDPVLRELRRRAIRGDMTTGEAIAAGIAQIDTQVDVR